ncbi:translocation/assembly module TamB domain-containing protein [Frigidibacter sp. RF13]|uniref:translocation/assembly module TamB domain-containing protein n=1 Tax=Frigidibacter sp. RF13 TaxID=2997340 RepID=UPI00226DE1BD|nr:translocation/assembly module TamB domain-containing protein [Frigidibacter sp. RF13]MCY1126417.1 translocation/assembly module TamB domain-containing protein [Frigidibacter sp. RF13]
MRRWVLALALLLTGGLAGAQEASESDKDFLTGLLEGQLSGAGRTVTIYGFAGALSSRATFDRLAIADAEGVWLTIEDGAIQWNRSALLSGRVEIAELSAARIDLIRSPKSEDTTAEARSFKLPELPVSVSIGALSAADLRIGAAVLGEEARVSVTGQGQIANGEGTGALALRRIDGRTGDMTLQAAYSNAEETGTIDLLVKEGEGGIAARMLDLPGLPSLQLALHGSGGAADFRSDLVLSTDGVSRFSGTIETKSPPNAKGVRSFAARLQGDISPLLQPDYRPFFAGETRVEADGETLLNGEKRLSRLVVESAGTDLSGRLNLSADNLPLAAALTVRLGLPDSAPLQLPGSETTVKNGVLKLRYNAAAGESWALDGALEGLATGAVTVGSITLDGRGTLSGVAAEATGAAQLDGHIKLDATAVALSDPALAAALGDRLSGAFDLRWQEGAPLRLTKLDLRAGDMTVKGDVDLVTDGLDLAADGRLSLMVPDMARFSALAGRQLGGKADLTVAGNANLLSRAFDMQATANGQDLSVDQPMANRLLAGRSTIEVDARRDETGIALEDFRVSAANLRLSAQGYLDSKETGLRAELDFPDLSVLGPGFSGALAAEADLSGPNGSRRLRLTGTADGLVPGSPTLAPLFAGRTAISAEAVEREDGFALAKLTSDGTLLSADLAETESGRYAVKARLADVAALAPGLAGPLDAAGTAALRGGRVTLDLSLTGPGAMRGHVTGGIATDLSDSDLSLTGQAQLALLNRFIAPRSIDGGVAFDLAMRGAPGLSALSGRITASGARLSSPADNLALEGIALSGAVSGGHAVVTGSGTVRGGGGFSVKGDLALSPDAASHLAVALDNVTFSDPSLYSSRLSADLTLDGPLGGGAVIGGRVVVHESEIRLSSALSSVTADLDVRHVNGSADTRASRRRAGMDRRTAGPGGGSAGPVYGLDLTISAPARIFVRGLGLEAEMGGSLLLGGTTAAVIPAGQFELIRGRLTILGKRFVLDRGIVQLLGSFIPYVEFTALSDSFGATTTILLEGPANKPEIHFTSTSGLQEEEVLSELLFGNSISKISTFQLLQLADAIATLTGRTDESVVVKLRKSIGLDDLDITADEDGKAAVKAGKYLSDKTYSEISIGQDGKSKVEIEIDLNRDLTLKGAVGTDGQTGVGVFFTKDY